LSISNNEVDKIHQHLNNGTTLSRKINENWNSAIKKTQQLLEHIETTVSLSTEIPESPALHFPSALNHYLIFLGNLIPFWIPSWLPTTI
jgi:hypothetical protein